MDSFETSSMSSKLFPLSKEEILCSLHAIPSESFSFWASIWDEITSSISNTSFSISQKRKVFFYYSPSIFFIIYDVFDTTISSCIHSLECIFLPSSFNIKKRSWGLVLHAATILYAASR